MTCVYDQSGMLFLFVAQLAFSILFSVSSGSGCGKRPSSPGRVINGDDAVPNSWPWQVSLRYSRSGNHHCGGTLIKPDWVLTTASCVEGKHAHEFKVAVGAHWRHKETAVQQNIAVSAMYEYKGYSSRYKSGDLALIKLAHAVNLSAEINTVCLPASNSRVKPGTNCYVTGWGRIFGDDSSGSYNLQQVMLPVVDHDRCASQNDQWMKRTVNKATMICAGGQGKGICKGDGGSPLVCKEGGKWVLRGAASWTDYKCRTRYFSVFARVSSFINWIHDTIKKAESCEWETTDQKCCVFPFIYNGKTYHNCIHTGHIWQWCSLTANYDKDKQWGNC